MPTIKGPEEATVLIKFGGGLRSRAPSDEIEDRECSDGQNFDQDLQNTQLSPRQPFDLLGTVPNGGEIRGMASLLTPSGDVSMLVQADDTVYEWTGTAFVSKGTVSATARLRGHIWHNWQLDPAVVLITDINLSDVVMSWDGTTLSDVTFTDEDGAGFGAFKAKYCLIQNERAIFANVIDATATELPHMMVGSEVEDYTVITVANKPSSALGEDDPFYLLTPDLRYINGFVYAFDTIIASTQEGQIFKLFGASAKDFQMANLHPRSGVAGDESMKFVGNDVFYGRQGRIESLAATDQYGDVETDDLSVDITDLIEDYNDWTLTYNERTQKVYCYPQDKAEIWRLYKPLIQSDVSPWSRYKTVHSMAFNPKTIMNCYDPEDGLEYVFMGDGSGNLYRMEGTRSGGDAGVNNVRTERLSKMVLLPDNTEAFTIIGWVRYRKVEPVTIKLQFEFQGNHIFTESIQVELEGTEASAFYGGSYYYGGSSYYGTDLKRFKREQFGVPGQSTEFQVRAIIDTKSDFAISEIGLRFDFSN
jgi:hypothetical protein